MISRWEASHICKMLMFERFVLVEEKDFLSPDRNRLKRFEEKLLMSADGKVFVETPVGV